MVNIDIELCTKSIRDNNYLMAEDSYINSLKEKIMYFLRWDDLALKEKEFAKGLIDNTHDINELISGYTNWLINNRFEDSFIACYTNRVLYSFVNDMKNDLWFFHGCFKIFAWEKELIDKFGKNVIIYLEEYLLCSYMSDCVEYMNDFMYCWELINKADVGLAIPYFEYCLIQGCYKTFVSHFLVLYDRYYSIDTELCEDKINCVKDFLENGQSSKVWNKFNKMRNEMPMMLKFNEQCRSTPEWFRFYVERNFYELKNCYAKKERIVL